MEHKGKVTSVELSERSLLGQDQAAGNLYASLGDLADGFEGIQVRRVLLPHEVHGRICSRIQGAQEFVIVKAGDSSLKKKVSCGKSNWPDAPINKQVIEVVQAWQSQVRGVAISIPSVSVILQYQ